MRAPLVRRLLFAAAAALLAACSENPTGSAVPASPVEITPDRTTYARGEVVTFTLHNAGNARISYGGCGEILERRFFLVWKKLVYGPNVCDAAVLYLDPGASAIAEYGIRAGQSQGIYRVNYPGLGSSHPFVVR